MQTAPQKPGHGQSGWAGRHFFGKRLSALILDEQKLSPPFAGRQQIQTSTLFCISTSGQDVTRIESQCDIMALLIPLKNEKSAHAETSAMRHPASRPASHSTFAGLLTRTIFRPALLLILSLFSSFSALAYDCKVDGIYYDITPANRTASVTRGSYSGDVVIPESIVYNNTTYYVISIGYDAFERCAGLTSVIIPNSVTSIGSGAFYGCTGLTSVIIPNSVTSIGSAAFFDCSRLTSVVVDKNNGTYDSRNNCNAIIETSTNRLIVGSNNTIIPNSVTAISDCAFYNRSGLTSATIPNSVTSIGDNAFYGCSGLTSVIIPNSVTSIGDCAFFGCSGLTSVSIPNSVTSIGYIAFACCSGLTSVTIPNSVTSIGNHAFANCSGLTSVSIPNSITSIGKNAFFRCSSLTSVIIPNSVLSIGEGAFSLCTGLTSVTIGNSVSTIGDSAFDCCKELTSIVIPSSVTSIGRGVFADCEKLVHIVVASDNMTYDSRGDCNAIIASSQNELISACNNTIIPNSVTSIGESAFTYCTKLTSILIPNSVVKIGGYAFGGCNGLTSIIIPNSVTSIGKYAFANCSGLTSVVVDKDNGRYDSRDNCNAIIETYTNKLVVGCKNTIIPNSVTAIGDGAFGGCSGLTSITIPNSVTSIGNSAFDNCSGLTSVIIPNSVTSIGGWAFLGCTKLSSVTFNAEKCTEMGSNDYSVFYACTNLTTLTIGDKVTIIPDYAFFYCTKLTKLVSLAVEPPICGECAFEKVDKTTCQLLVPEESINKYKTADQWKDFLNILGYNGVDDVSVDTQNAVYEVYNLQGVRVGSGMHETEITADALPHGVYILVSPQGRKKLKI